MKPSRPHSFFTMSVSVCEFAQPGTPLIALNEHMTVSAPASIAALNGGRYMFRRRCSDMSVVL